MSNPYEPNSRALGTIIAPPNLDAPEKVHAALQAQKTALTALWDHFNETENVLADNWQQIAEDEMLTAAATDQPFDTIMDDRRTQRVAAITRHRVLERELRSTIREARASLMEWLHKPGTLAQFTAADEAARKTELQALRHFADARADWLRTTSVTQWAALAAGANRAVSIPDFTGRPVAAAGTSIEVHELLEVARHVEREHKRADQGTQDLSDDRNVILTGKSGVTFAVPATNAPGLRNRTDKELNAA